MALINDHIKNEGPTARAEIVELIKPHMPTGSSHDQCVNKADNLMRKMKQAYHVAPKIVDGKRVWTIP